jgi:hypothetical protein
MRQERGQRGIYRGPWLREGVRVQGELEDPMARVEVV